MTDEQFESIKRHVMSLLDQTDEAELNFIAQGHEKDIAALGLMINNASLDGNGPVHQTLCFNLFALGYKAAKAEEEVNLEIWDD